MASKACTSYLVKANSITCPLMWLLSQSSILQGMLCPFSAADARQQHKCWRDAASQTHDIKSVPASGAAQLPKLSNLSLTPLERPSGANEMPTSTAQKMGASARDEKSTVRQLQGSVVVDSRAEQSRQGLTRSHSAPLQSREQRACAGQTASSSRVGRTPAGSDSAPPQSAEVQHAAAAAEQAGLSLHSCTQPGTPNRADKQARYSRLSGTRQMEAPPPHKSSHMQAVHSVSTCSRSNGRQNRSALCMGHASTGHCSGAAHEERAAEARTARHGPEAAAEAAQSLQHVFTVCVQSLEGLDRLRGHGVAPSDGCYISYTIPGRSLGLRLAWGSQVDCRCMHALICRRLTAHGSVLGVLRFQGDGTH